MKRFPLLLTLCFVLQFNCVANLIGQDANEPVSKIYLAPDDHTDYFWTADDVVYRAAFIETLDYYLDLIDKTESEPSHFQARWNCDGSLWLWEYEQNKTPQEFERLIGRIKDGHISSPLTALVSTYGAQPAEAVLRGMYYAGSLERRYDLRFPIAVSIENQTLPLGVGALWSGAGAKYSWRGICACATKLPYNNFHRRENEVYWWRGLDGSQILMKWYSLGLNNSSIGGYAEIRRPGEAIDWVRNDPGFKKRHPFDTIGLFGQGWDDLKTLSDAIPKIAKEKSLPDQRVVVSNEEDYFREFERRHGGSINSESLAYGNEWDLLCASMAEQTARVRRSVEKLRNAEAMATLVSLNDPEFWSSRKPQRDLAHLNLGLYWEHDWTADNGPEMRAKRAKWQRKLADQISRYVNELHDAAAKQMANQIPNTGQHERFFVFNSLGQSRNGWIEIELPAGVNWRPVTVPDSNPLRCRLKTKNSKRFLQVFVPEIPGVGYRVISMQPGQPKLETVHQAAQANVLENGSWRVEVANSGAIKSVIEKQTGRELVGSLQWNVLNTFQPGLGRKPIRLAEASYGKLTRVASDTIEVRVDDGVPYTTQISLRGDAHQIEIENTIRGVFGDVRTWDFDFNLTDPTVRHEEVGAILTAKLESDGGHYANRNARYDWMSLGHFANISGSEGTITLANRDGCFFQVGNSTVKELDANTPSLSVLVGGQVDDAKLGIPFQNGDDKFTQRFALKLDSNEESIDAMNFSLRWQNPLVVRKLTNKKSPPSSTKNDDHIFQLLSLDQKSKDSKVVLWGVKPSEEGIENGMVVRLWNLDDQASHTNLSSSKFNSAYSITHIETPTNDFEHIGPLVPLKFKPQQMRSLLLKK